MRTVATILASLVAKLPAGWVLALRGGVLDAVLESFASRLAEAEADAAILMDEIDPRRAVRLLLWLMEQDRAIRLVTAG